MRSLAASLGVRPTKQRGQNFVIDPNTVRRIVRAASLSDGETVLEVGPGLGSLTLALLADGHRVTAVEIDSLLASALPSTIATYAPDQADRLTHGGALDRAGFVRLPLAPVADVTGQVDDLAAQRRAG